MRIISTSLCLIPLGFADIARAEVDFSQLSIWGSSSVERLSQSLRGQGVQSWFSFHDGGYGANYQDTILAHHGSRPPSLQFTPDQLAQLAAFGQTKVSVSNLVGLGAFHPLSGQIAGTDITGELTYSTDEGAFLFKRLAGSAALESAKSYDLSSKSGAEYAKGLQILNIGKNDIFALRSEAEIIAATESAYQHASQGGQNVLILGHFAHADGAASARQVELTNKVNEALKAKYGSRFIDQNAYLLGAQIWKDLGITPIAEDLDYQARGLLAPSLAEDNIHLKSSVSDLVTRNLLLPAIEELFNQSPQITAYKALVQNDLLPSLAQNLAAFDAKTAQQAAQLRLQRAYRVLSGQGDGLQISLKGGADRAKGLSTNDKNLNVDLSYGHEDWSFALGIQREQVKGDFAHKQSKRRETAIFGSVARHFGAWHIAADFGHASANLEAETSGSASMDYSADLRKSFITGEIGYTYQMDDWKILSSTWLRRQKISVESIDFLSPVAIRNSIVLDGASATYAGLGVTFSYQGWQDVQPSLSLSYEDQISAAKTNLSSLNRFVPLADGHLKGLEGKSNVAAELAVSVALRKNTYVSVFGSYGSADKNKGLGLSLNWRF